MNTNYTLHSLRIKNYRSFCDEQAVSFETPVTAFYGANASGKSNIFKALFSMWNFIKNSTLPNTQAAPFLPAMQIIPYEPFLLREGDGNEPTVFDIMFGNQNNTYRYTFSTNSSEITEEAMFDLSTSRERTIFVRSKGQNSTATKNGFGKKIFETTRSNSLLITRAQEYANAYAGAVFDFLNNLHLITINGNPPLRPMAINIMQQNPNIKKQVLSLLRKADFPIRDFMFAIDDIPKEIIDGMPLADPFKAQLRGQKNTFTQTVHSVRNDVGDITGAIAFNMDAQESIGTNVFFDIIVPIIDTLNSGKVLYIDEFNSSLHIDICELIVRMFKENNTGAKLIINTHDVGLMKSSGGQGVLDDKDIVYVEKDMFEQSIVTPHGKKRTARKDDNIEKKYRFGVYGGKPIVRED
jgi:AAA15 family ATPase/GTPase